LKFSYPNSTIIVAAKANAKQLAEIEIIDYGIGMNKELLENLFVANQNTGRFGTDGESSSGLGLHICKDFIERNGGKLTVKSTKEKGSTFSFTLPLATLQNSSNNS
jgi:signal transduction histidine kinase